MEDSLCGKVIYSANVDKILLTMGVVAKVVVFWRDGLSAMKLMAQREIAG